MSYVSSSLRIELPRFEGPMALLLYLIKKEEMDIMDIPIHQITQQYLEYVKMMKEMDLELAGDFVAMAATLIQIKSQMLLPQYTSDAENGEEVPDPRRPLVQRLLEYQQIQEAAAKLSERVWLGRDVLTRDFSTPLLPQNGDQEGIEIDSENMIFSLIRAYRLVIRAAEKRVHKVAKRLKSIAQRISEIRSFFSIGQSIALRSLIQWDRVTSFEEKRFELLLTFLSVLEMAKMGFVRLFQSNTYQEIYVEAIADLNELNLSQVDEFEVSSTPPAGNNPSVVSLDPEEWEALDSSEASPGTTVSQGPGQEQDSRAQESKASEEDLTFQEMASDEDIAQAEAELGLSAEESLS